MQKIQKPTGGGSISAVELNETQDLQEEDFDLPFPTKEEIEELFRRIIKRRKKFQKAEAVILKFPSSEEGYVDFYDGYAFRNFFQKFRSRYVQFADANGGEVAFERMFETYEEDGVEWELNYPKDWN